MENWLRTSRDGLAWAKPKLPRRGSTSEPSDGFRTSSRRESAVAVAPLLVVAALALAGCHRADSVLLVEVAGDVTLPVAQLSANVTIGTTTHMLLVPPAPTSISLPTSFTVALSRDLTGPVTVAIDALDAAGALLASGQTVQQHIDVGDDTVIPVKLGSGDPVVDDAGAPTP